MADAEVLPEMEMTAATAALILAAGQSSRLGQPKQLVQLGEHTLLRQTVLLALKAGAFPVFVVLAPPTAEACRATLHGLSVVLIENPQPQEGMGSSLRVGMQALAQHTPHAQRVLLLVSDQPRLRLDNVQALLQAGGTVAAAEYSGRCGVPAVFARQHFAALAAVTGDQGARSVLKLLPVTAVPMPEAAVDLDTPEDLAALQRLP
jgi:molybdenum cofactor cytidylyltransferase